MITNMQTLETTTEMYNKPIELPKTVPLWVVTLMSLLLGFISFYSLYSDRKNKIRNDSIESEIVKLSTQLDNLLQKTDVDEKEINKAKKQAELFFEQVKKLKARQAS